MVPVGVILLCLQAVLLNEVISQALPCNGNNLQNLNISPLALSNLGASSAAASLIGNAISESSPLTITSATFTPITNALASQAGLPRATVSEVVPNLQFGDVTVSGDLPIGGTIKVSGCFPVYGMVEVDGVVPSAGTAVVSAAQQFPAQAQSGTCICK